MPEFDYILVGGGLQNGMIVQALRNYQPDARIALVERGEALGGNHTWCFHAEDVGSSTTRWLEPLVVHRWPGYRVRFPSYERTIAGEYSAVTSPRLHEVVAAAIGGHQGSRLLLGASAVSVEPTRVVLDSGDSLEGTAVVDARGPGSGEPPQAAGYQKFVGLELELAGTHEVELPVLMDATVDQSHGYRFFYVLPLGPTRLLIEDTYFHELPSLDLPELRDGILRYAEGRGWRPVAIAREEVGVLPMPWRGSFRLPRGEPLVAGYRGGWFHPGTGYSLPVAARLAEFVARRPPEALFGRELEALTRSHDRQARYTRLLNRFLFRWFPPRARVSVFERFYRLPEATIGNFYALRLNWLDRYRLVAGRPPGGLSLRYRLRNGADE